MWQSLGKLLCVLIVLLATVSAVNVSRAASEPLLVRSVGLLDADGTALYSVVIASGSKPLSKLVVTGNIPAGMEFVEALSAPPEATAHVEKNAVSWQVKTLDADTILGPFTYRVRLKDKAGSAPLAAGALVKWTEPTAGTTEAAANQEKLEALAETGTLSIDSKGTLNAKGENDLVLVGKTGILVYVPADAVSKPTTLTFTRLKIDDKSVPANQKDVWWCTVVSVTSSPEVPFTKPISVVLPTRRTLTPGLSAQLFAHSEDSNWQKLALAPAPAGNAFVAPSGNQIVIPQLPLDKGRIVTSAGVPNGDRTKAAVSGSNLPTAGITDGLSNTVFGIPYIEQDNIIAILIGIRIR